MTEPTSDQTIRAEQLSYMGFDKDDIALWLADIEHLRAEVDRLEKGIIAASHLLMAATGPTGGPLWPKTLVAWQSEFKKTLEGADNEIPSPDHAL